MGADADDRLLRAELLDTLAAIRALEARSYLVPNADPVTECRLGDSATGLLDGPHHLVTWDEGKPRVAPNHRR
jgi:hypothetical protein